ncbi:phosphoglucosamine mutase [Aequoribacter sp.]|jgi:phosphoglucosamine mutase|uniref:phosphoglucosamine mutase n=1 Tax=Aequoribacter sp. TaxID=2847771 RepID=UPI003C5D68A2
MSKRYFGTDGIRGEVGVAPITPDFMLKLGWAAGKVFAAKAGKQRPLVVIGKDTRVSGYMFESALEAGLVAAGVDVRLLGPMPTPAVSVMTQTLNATAGIVISASHNPFQDNGIKFFGHDGGKLGDELEFEIEAMIDRPLETSGSSALGKVVRINDAGGRYIEYCKSTVPRGFSLAGLNLVVDCANGATYHVAPAVFQELGANVTKIGTEPNGFNINAGVGSTDMSALAAQVRQTQADLGIAFDGDGDRVLFVDHQGAEIDGDQLLYVMAKSRQQRGCNDQGVVGTLMSNLGLEVGLKALGLGFFRAKVGDRYVKEAMLARGWVLGGESSGHLICTDVSNTGDGIVSALQVLRAVVESGDSLRALCSEMDMMPQTMINVRMSERVDITTNPQVQAAVAEVESALGDSGRVLLRLSGTEPLVRVMVEGSNASTVNDLCASLATKVEQALAD